MDKVQVFCVTPKSQGEQFENPVEHLMFALQDFARLNAACRKIGAIKLSTGYEEMLDDFTKMGPDAFDSVGDKFAIGFIYVGQMYVAVVPMEGEYEGIERVLCSSFGDAMKGVVNAAGERYNLAGEGEPDVKRIEADVNTVNAAIEAMQFERTQVSGSIN